MSRAFIFPGQGSQFIGMGKDLAEAFPIARETFEEVDDTLGQKLFHLMTEGSESELNLTENTQPALMAVSMAIINVLTRDAKIQIQKACNFVAGHSLGEYSALCAAGALDLPVTARLLKYRGQVMQEAVPVGKGGMAAVLGLDFDTVKSIAISASQNGKVCEAANDNSVGQVVLSGHKEALAIAIDSAKEKGAKRAIELPVSAPFHCSLMAPAAQKMATALADTNIRPPSIPVVSNVTAQGSSEPSTIRQLLVDQVTGTVRWRESIIWMKEQGVEDVIEIGAGNVLSGLVRRIDKEITTKTVGTPEQVEELITQLQ